MLLPAVRPIAEAEEDLGLIEGFARGLGGEEALSLPPAVSKLERQLVLTELVSAWSAAMRQRAQNAGGDDDAEARRLGAGAQSPAQAAHLAIDLAKLMDAVETENVSLQDLAALVPDDFTQHWQKTIEFLEIVTKTWPAYLSERALLSPMHRRNRLILAEAKRLQATPPSAPVIIAGVTGSIPATAELMRAVLALPNGAIVLPALDKRLDEASWKRIADAGKDHPEHPQFGFRGLLARLDFARSDVQELPGPLLSASAQARNSLISEAMRPAGSMERWRTFIRDAERSELEAGLEHVSLLEAPAAEDEAEAIALIMREAAETPGRTAALVSPDRLLARRVAIRLESWGIRVDDSAGRPFGKTVPGTFLDLAINAWAMDFKPAELMALLKHPLTRLGLSAGDVRRTARNLEIAAFRAPYLGAGLDAVDLAVERAAHATAADSGDRRHGAARRLGDRDWAHVRDLVKRLHTAFEPLLTLAADGRTHPLRMWTEAHSAVAEAVARPAPETLASVGAEDLFAFADASDSPLWQGEAGEAAWKLFESFADPVLPPVQLAASDYPDFYRALVAGETVRARIPAHPRLSIWGPFEARLQQPDVMILGSLNEGTWPAVADPGAWLNRPMRQNLGLPAPEEEIGRAAHDVTTFLGAETVILTRADKVDGVPRVPSRWLLRLRALLDGLGLTNALAPRSDWLGWARARDYIRRLEPVAPPQPKPPIELRPKRASVSDIETWIANPYAIFARRVLRLDPLPLLGAEPGPAEKGQVIHLALSRFTERYPVELPTDIAGAFMQVAADVVRDFRDDPRVRAFWLPRLQRFADWFAATEPDRREGVSTLLAEVSARHILAVPGEPFELSARADRIDVTVGGLIITDYKTGQVPSASFVLAGAKPQLPLEAALAFEGAFSRLEPMPVLSLRYIRATGADPAGQVLDIKPRGDELITLARNSLAGATRLIAEFRDPETPFRALRRPCFKYDYDDFAHLARVGEWTAESGDEEVA